MKVSFSEFKGTAPKYNPEQLGEGMAQAARNTKAGRYTLEPWHSPLLLDATIPAGTRYLTQYLDTYWFTAAKPTEWAVPPLVNDTFDYMVITDEKYPKITRNDVAISSAPYPSATYRLGIPAPDKPVVVKGANNPDAEHPEDTDDLDKFAVEYKIAVVDAWGRVGPCSEASNRIDIQEYENAMMYAIEVRLPRLPAGNYPFGAGTKYWIYRSNLSSAGPLFQFCAEVPATQTTYKDLVASADLMEELTHDDWVGAPDDDKTLYPNGPLRYVATNPVGFMFGTTKKELCFSEPGTVHAWPVKYRQSIGEDIVRAVVVGADIFVATKGYPYLFTGVHPESVSPMRLDYPVPLAGPEAITVVDGRVFFASNSGLWAVSGATMENISEAFYTDDQWEAMEPSKMRFAQYDNRLFIFRDGHDALVFNPREAAEGFRTNSQPVSAFCNDPDTGDMLVFDNSNLGVFGKGESRLPITYRSRVVKTMVPVAFTWIKVRANQYPLDITVHAEREDGSTVSYTKTIKSYRAAALPFRTRATRWFIEVEGTPEIRSVELANTMKELS